jgi:hypothetical protein
MRNDKGLPWILFCAIIGAALLMLGGESPPALETLAADERHLCLGERYVFERRIDQSRKSSGAQVTLADEEECRTEGDKVFFNREYVVRARSGRASNRYRYEGIYNFKTGLRTASILNMTDREEIQLRVVVP